MHSKNEVKELFWGFLFIPSIFFRTSDENFGFIKIFSSFFLHFLLLLITINWFKTSSSGFLCSCKGPGGQFFEKKKKLHSLSCFQDGRHSFLELVCTLSPACCVQLFSNFVQSLILHMGGSLFIFGQIDKKYGRQL